MKLAQMSVIAGLTAALWTSSDTPAPAAATCAPGYHCLFIIVDGNILTHSFFSSAPNFSTDTYPDGQVVDNNSDGASNASTSGYESHYYSGYNSIGFMFCLNPGSTVLPLPNNLRDSASSLSLRSATSIPCLS